MGDGVCVVCFHKAKSSPEFVFLALIILAMPAVVRWYLTVVLICIFLMAIAVEHFFCVFLGHFYVLLVERYVRVFAYVFS